MSHDAAAALRVPVLAAALLLGCGACAGGLLPRPPAAPDRHTLDTAAAPAPDDRVPMEGTPVLVVERLRPAPGYDTAHMLYVRRPQTLESYARHAWADTPARLLAPLLVRALQDTAAFRAVLLAPSAATGGLRLETDVVRLHQDFLAVPSHVRLTVRAVLVDAESGQVVAWREVDARVPAPSDDPAGGIAAAGQAAQEVLATVAAFCARHARP